MMAPLLSISKVYGLLQQDESQKETQTGLPSFSSDSAGFQASMNSNSSNNKPYNQRVSFHSNKNQTVFCKYCKKPSHTIESCFPADFKFAKNKKPAASCVQMINSPIQSPSNSTSSSVLSSQEMPSAGFSKEQYEHLMTLFQQARLSHGFWTVYYR